MPPGRFKGRIEDRVLDDDRFHGASAPLRRDYLKSRMDAIMQHAQEEIHQKMAS